MMYMQSTILVRSEETANFNEIMPEVVAIQEAQGWRLSVAFMQLTGTFGTFVDIWEMEDAAHFQRGLTGLRGHSEFPRIKAVLAKAVISETVVLGLPSPFLPQRD